MVFVTLKYIIIGDSEVGKSSLLLQFTEQTFVGTHDLTIGVEFGAKLLDLDSRKVKLEIWDTAGQETFLSITRSYYRGADGVLLVYDIGKRDSFLHLGRWLQECQQNCMNSGLEIMVVGMKADLPPEQRQVSSNEAAEWAARHGLHFIEASAKTAQNVEKVFVETATTILRNFDAANPSPGPPSVAKISLNDKVAPVKPPTECC
ncbi:rab family, other [Saprolegnia diclina VS20]|uniref:Rab family, other n=1 Tax=Saprolegnia diclina (strain VS20) TaxID=1156394 RepID=T0QIK1_SAPDV|nr:rab family, other [Saprolegnia diclina VS20]EQC34541.1 rab family, other [Saprolegnia diclina VS20]|eukprot:XP_008611947.1 rab family, other [Saprolegnia diclina VS20]